MFEISKAAPDQFEAVREFYWTLIDMMQNAAHKPGWVKGVYPSDDYLFASIQNGELFAGLLGGQTVSAMIVNRSCNESYARAVWPTPALEGEADVIHALGVLPTFCGRGFASGMVRFALERAKRRGQQAVRLDVLCGNLPAERLYAGLGFRYVGTVSMYYENTGVTDFKLYEYPL